MAVTETAVEHVIAAGYSRDLCSALIASHEAGISKDAQLDDIAQRAKAAHDAGLLSPERIMGLTVCVLRQAPRGDGWSVFIDSDMGILAQKMNDLEINARRGRNA